MSKGKLIKQIFKDHWAKFLEMYGHMVRDNVKREVLKMLECGSYENGYIEFK